MQALLDERQIAVIIQNTDNLTAWRKKMRCIKAVQEIDPDCDGYQDLRNGEQKIACFKLVRKLNEARAHLRRQQFRVVRGSDRGAN